MKRFIAGEDRQQITLLPNCLDDYITTENLVRLVEVLVDELDLSALGFASAVLEATDRTAHHPATLLKIYLYGYLNRIPSSRCFERESQRNIELIWLTSRLMPEFKTLADFRKDNGPAIHALRTWVQRGHMTGWLGGIATRIPAPMRRSVAQRAERKRKPPGAFSLGAKAPSRRRLLQQRGLDMSTPEAIGQGDPNSVAADQLKSIIDRIERLEDENAGIAGDIKDVYAEAKATGYV